MVRGHQRGRPGVADLTPPVHVRDANSQATSPLIEAEALIIANATGAGDRWIVNRTRY
jgi:hypothetical protein